MKRVHRDAVALPVVGADADVTNRQLVADLTPELLAGSVAGEGAHLPMPREQRHQLPDGLTADTLTSPPSQDEELCHVEHVRITGDIASFVHDCEARHLSGSADDEGVSPTVTPAAVQIVIAERSGLIDVPGLDRGEIVEVQLQEVDEQPALLEGRRDHRHARTRSHTREHAARLHGVHRQGIGRDARPKTRARILHRTYRWDMGRAVLRAVAVGLLAVLGLVVPVHVAWGRDDSPEPGPERVELLLFWGDGCPHCAAEKAWLTTLKEQYPELEVREYEVWYDSQNRRLFEQVAAEHGIDPQGVPGTFVGEAGWIGFNDVIAYEIEDAVRVASQGGSPQPSQQNVVDIPLIGQVDLGGTSLVVSTVVIGFVDGVNPCSLWVLTVLLALVLHSGSRRRVTAVGGTFLVVTAAMYALYVIGIFSVLSFVGYISWIQRTMALVVAVLGVLQIKDYVWFHRGPSLGIGEGAKPGLFGRMRGLGTQDRPLPAVLLATTGLAVGVSLMETPCTVGLPMIWVNLVSQQEIGATGAAVLFLLYMSVFLVDELLVFGAVIITMRATKLQERHGRELKLASGTVMLALASVMVFAPSVMESVWGVVATFGAAAVVVAAVLASGRARAGDTRGVGGTRSAA